MKLIIDISEKDYHSVMYSHHVPYGVVYAITNDKPLPKGHGRLIDADKFLKDNEAYTGWILNSSDWGGENAYKDTLEDLVNDAPTIIEAERGEEDDAND